MNLERSFQGSLIRFGGRDPATATTLKNVSALSNLITYSALGAAAKLQVSSSSAADDGSPVGTGALTLRIVGLDANYKWLTEDIVLNGQTQVETAGSFLRVFAAFVLLSGTGLTNAGDIYVIKTGTGGTVTGGVPGTLTSGWVKILAGTGCGTSGVFTIPAGKSYEFREFRAESRAQVAEVSLFSHNPTSTTENTVYLEDMWQVGTGNMRLGIPTTRADTTSLYPLVWGEKTDLYIRALSATAGAILSAEIVLEEYRPRG